ncbi:MAG: hypothetical protein Q9159_005791 [Coniocarpon cinnabarinum]
MTQEPHFEEHHFPDKNVPGLHQEEKLGPEDSPKNAKLMCYTSSHSKEYAKHALKNLLSTQWEDKAQLILTQIGWELDKSDSRIDGEVLTLNPVDSKQRLDPQGRDFESQARRLRYEAIGRACKRDGIDSLLLGHHADDQAETVLSRIGNGYTGLGLVGIKNAGRIPECRDVAGVGEFMDTEDSDNRTELMCALKMQHRAFWTARDPETQHKGFQESDHDKTSLLIKHALVGVKIHRPFLDFYKENLVQTCTENNIPWVEDDTNLDRTKTVRNTVRYLFQKDSLPQALQRERLLLARNRVSHVSTLRQEAVRSLREKFESISFDTSTGVLSFRFRTVNLEDLLRPSQLGGSAALGSQKHEIAAFKHLALPVARESLADVELDEKFLAHLLSIRTEGHQFLTRSLIWKLLKAEGNGTYTWCILRQRPRRAAHLAPICIWNLFADSQDNREGTWYLWDKRYWIGLRARQEIHIRCRASQPDDIQKVRETSDSAFYANLKRRLGGLVPVEARDNLPVLVDVKSNAVLAFPSLKLESAASRALFEYDVRYKAID